MAEKSQTDNTSTTPPPRWLYDAPLGKRERVQTEREQSPQRRSVERVWHDSLLKCAPDRYRKPITFKEGCMLREFSASVPENSAAVIEFTINNWSKFVWETRSRYGTFGFLPEEPYIPFFVKYHECAVNLFLQSIAKKKRDEEEAERQSRSQEAPELRPSAPAPRTPITLFLTPEQETIVFDPDHHLFDSYYDKIIAKYGGDSISAFGTPAQRAELLAGRVVKDCYGRVINAVLCDIPITADI